MRARSPRRLTGVAEIVAGALALALPAVAIGAAGQVTQAQARTTRATAAHRAHRPHPRIFVHRRARQKLEYRVAKLPGHLHGARPHSRVLLQMRDHHRWVTISRTRVGRRGGFAFRYRVRPNWTMWLRVRFPGARGLRPWSVPAGRMVGLSPTVASWYYDAGGTACGFHAGYGVANKTLPCGTHVSFSYHGHTVTATVDDRGPYVAGRSFDLNQNTARALGMSGVATVDASR